MKKVLSTLVVSSILVGITGCNNNAANVLPDNQLNNQIGISSTSGVLKEQTYNTSKMEAVPGEIIVALKENRGFNVTSIAKSFGSKFNLATVDTAPDLNAFVVTSNSREATKDLIAKLNQEPEVEVAGPNYLYKMALDINDPMAQQQYALDKVNARQAWDITQGNPGVTIAIVDTGIDLTHPDLKSKLVPGMSAIKKDQKAENKDFLLKGGDDNGHGTHCAGIAAAIGNNGTGVAGLALKNKIMPVRVLGGAGSGSMFSIAKGLAWAAENGARVISMSLGGPSSVMDLIVERSVKKAVKNDVVMVVAMGNSSKEEQMVPAVFAGKYDQVIAVGATDSEDKKAPFSTWGSHITVGAPGVAILSTMPTYDVFLTENYGFSKNYAKLSGTSMATPAVSGLVGLMRSQFPNLKAAQIKAKLQESTEDLGPKGFDKLFGYGRIDALKAVSK